MPERLADFFAAGGVLLHALALVSVLLWTLILERYWFYYRIYPARVRRWIEEWRTRSERASWFAHRIREAVISAARLQLEHSVPVIRTLIALCPLMGVLGTVTGMIEVFEVIAVKGTGDAKAMAGGVARATIPTMAGMVVALSGLYFASRLKQLAARETERLADEMSFT